MKPDFEALTREREEAWVGDAVLALFVREWILREKDALDGDIGTRHETGGRDQKSSRTRISGHGYVTAGEFCVAADGDRSQASCAFRNHDFSA